MKSSSRLLLSALLFTLAAPSPALEKTQDPWELIGPGRELYETGAALPQDGGASAARLRCLGAEAALPGVLARIIPAEDYRGQFLRYSALLKYSGVQRQVGLWMSVLDDKHRVIAIKFMDAERHLLRGDADWRRQEIGFRIPKNAETIVFGLRLMGPGEAVIRETTLETGATAQSGTWIASGAPLRL